jgi:hypothetical protein
MAVICGKNLRIPGRVTTDGSARMTATKPIANSKHYAKPNHYIFRPVFDPVIHHYDYLFTSCWLHAKQNSFTVPSRASLTSHAFSHSCTSSARS